MKIFFMLLSANDNRAKQVKLLLDSYGFTYVWINPDWVNLKTFHVLFKKCVLDNFKQAWWQNICNSVRIKIWKQVWVLRLILTFNQKSSELDNTLVEYYCFVLNFDSPEWRSYLNIYFYFDDSCAYIFALYTVINEHNSPITCTQRWMT